MMEGWKEYKLGDLVKLQQGFAVNRKSNHHISDEITKYPLLKISDLLRGTESLYVKDSIPKQFLVNEDEIIYSRSGQVGYAFMGRKGVVYNNCFRVTANEKIDTKYLYLFLNMQYVRDIAVSLATGAAQPDLNHGAFKSIKIELPPLPTQRKIASILSAYDDLIENNLQRIKLLEEMAQQTYTEWFVRMKFPRHESVEWDEESGLPVGWEKVKLGDFVKTSSGGTPSRRKLTEYYEKGTIPWVRTGELRNFMLIDSEEKITKKGLQYSSAKMYPKNTVLLAMYGNTIGETTFLSFEASSNQACCAFLTDGDNSLSYYLHQFFLNSKTYVLGFRMGAAQENISQQLIKSMEIVNPTELLLKSFGVEMEKVYTTIENLLKQNQRLKEARDILLPRLMMGVIEVSEL